MLKPFDSSWQSLKDPLVYPIFDYCPAAPRSQIHFFSTLMEDWEVVAGKSLQVQLEEDFGAKGIQLWALLLLSPKQSEWWPLRTLKERLLCIGGVHLPYLEGSMMQDKT